MTERRRWGKAGVPLTVQEAAARAARKGRRVVADQATREKWAQGLLVPGRITAALDIRKLDGPEVDVACGAAEPDVDRWEAGELYPTWEQVLALAKLTDFPVQFFVKSMENTAIATTAQFHGFGVNDAPRLRFEDEVVRECPGTNLNGRW